MTFFCFVYSDLQWVLCDVFTVCVCVCATLHLCKNSTMLCEMMADTLNKHTKIGKQHFYWWTRSQARLSQKQYECIKVNHNTVVHCLPYFLKQTHTKNNKNTNKNQKLHTQYYHNCVRAVTNEDWSSSVVCAFFLSKFVNFCIHVIGISAVFCLSFERMKKW